MLLCSRLRITLFALFCFGMTAPAARAQRTGAASPERTWKVCVAANAPAVVRAAAQGILDASAHSPLLQAFAGASAHPSHLTDSATLLAAKPQERAYSHLVLVGLPSDPLIQAAWQREARQTAPGAFYIFGFGYLSGDIGYIESDRNPFLHGIAIKIAPFETEVVTITGTTPDGVALAAHAFVEQGLVNGAVAAPGWKRPQTNLLERNPLAPNFVLPSFVPAAAGEMPRIAVTQASEDEYRGVLADTGVEPITIWRVKYHRPDAWDGVGATAAFANYAAGLHRRAYGDTLWCARFASAAVASAAAPKIAGAAGLKSEGAVWHGVQPPYTQGDSPGPLTLWQRGAWLLMSTLPDGPTQELLQAKEARK